MRVQFPPDECGCGENSDQDRRHRTELQSCLQLGDAVDQADKRHSHQQQAGDVGRAVRALRVGDVAQGDHQNDDRQDRCDEKAAAPTGVGDQQAGDRRRCHTEGVDDGEIPGDGGCALIGREDHVDDGQRQTAQERE